MALIPMMNVLVLLAGFSSGLETPTSLCFFWEDFTIDLNLSSQQLLDLPCPRIRRKTA